MTEEKERIARDLAFRHGREISILTSEGDSMTIAQVRGCKSEAEYANRYWQEFLAAAEYVLEQKRQSYDEGWIIGYNKSATCV